ncbi:hypothetical protein ACFPOG_12780 [Paenibacillus aestuarii]|uniref:VWA domain-containing protein n=1 Tax=Paenibacillus aestuarii TaxID=516965 RepID=A0ABW0K6V4_9BACL
MALAANVLKDKFQMIKDREGERLARFLRILFGNERFGFKWSTAKTSYTDGKDVYILYELQRSDCRPFSANELRALRKCHSIHERGHIEYDCIEDYFNWQKEFMSKDQSDWLSNEKYPLPWLQFFGNVMMDGRMENLTAIDHPTTKEYFDLGNYEWRFGIRGSHAGEDRISDFRECFMSRALAMTDIEEWHEEAVALVDTIQPTIEKARFDETTKDVLTSTTTMMKQVWPTLMDWMDLENQSPDEFDYSDEHANSKWGNAGEVGENVKRVMRILVKTSGSYSSEENKGDEVRTSDNAAGSSSSSSGDEDKQEDEGTGSSSAGSDNSEDNDPASSEGDGKDDEKTEKPDFSNILRLEEKNLAKDEQAAEDELGAYAERTQEVTIYEHREDRKAYSSTLTIKPFDNSSLDRYNRTLRELKRYISPTARALSALLEPVLDENRRNQRSGKLKVNRAWRTEALHDANIFDRRKKGTPGKNARMLILNDISGSTSSGFPGTTHRIIDEMRKAQTLLIESCEEAKIPVAAYGFTEDYNDGTLIHPFKPYGRFTNVEKGFIGGFNPKDGNRDTVALQWAVDELAKYTEDIRLLIMLSDGEPCFGPDEDYDTMRSIVQQAEKRGIDVLCLYCGPQYKNTIERVQFMYPGKALIVSKFLARELSTAVKRIIRKRR